MADRTPIEWTDASWNPIRGCTRVSKGCRNCYAEIMAARFSDPGQWGHGLARRVTLPDPGSGPGQATTDHRWTGKLQLIDTQLDLPLRWRRPRRIFVNSTSDLFHESVPDEWIDRVFAVMALAPQHSFQVLTKRPERMRAYFAEMEPLRISDLMHDWGLPVDEEQQEYAADMLDLLTMPRPLPNVWLGTSVEDQATADTRIPHLLATPAAIRFVSAEPLLGPVDLTRVWARMPGGGQSLWNSLHRRDPGESALDWVITGGESGPGARPMHPDWPRSLRDQCQAAGVAFFFKQWGEWIPWEMGSAPMWNAQNGVCEDGNWLFPSDMDADPNWDDGLAHYDPGETDHSAFQRVGKKAAGRHLDGREWNEMPGHAT